MIDIKFKTLILMAKLRNYTQVANELGLTQPAISTHIRQLEEEYGFCIFSKENNKLVLTPQGQILLSHAQKLLLLEDELKDTLLLSTKTIEKFKIGISENISEILLTNVVLSYANNHENCRFEIINLSYIDIYKKLKLMEIDFAFIETKNSDPTYKAISLKPDNLKVVLAPNNTYADNNKILLKELKNINLILPLTKNKARKLFENYLIDKGTSIEEFKILLELDNDEVIKQLISQNLGAGVMFEINCLNECKSGLLKAIPLESFNYERLTSLVYPRNEKIEDIVIEIASIYQKLVE